ncbi:MAG: twin-arginine translocase TatA/TatE family subunit [Verrucomicrobiota bacterium]
MLTAHEDPWMLAFVGGWEALALLAVILVILGASRLSQLGRGLREGISEFSKALDRQSFDAGKSLGGILGKPAAQALTPDNQIAELYDPAVFHREQRANRRRMRFRRWRRLWRRKWHAVLRRLRVGLSRQKDEGQKNGT